MSLQMTGFCSLSRLIIFHMYHIFFSHSFVDGHISCSHVPPVVCGAAVNTGVCMSFWFMIFSGLFLFLNKLSLLECKSHECRAFDLLCSLVLAWTPRTKHVMAHSSDFSAMAVSFNTFRGIEPCKEEQLLTKMVIQYLFCNAKVTN